MCYSGWGVDTEGGYVLVGPGFIWEISVSSSPFCCEPKIYF